MCLWDFYSVLQVSTNNRQTEVNCWIFAWKAYLPGTSIKYTMLIKYFRVWSWSMCFLLASGTFKILQIFLLPLQKGLLTSPGQTERYEVPVTSLQTAFCAIRAAADKHHLVCPSTSCYFICTPSFFTRSLRITLTIKILHKFSIMTFGKNITTLP